MLTKTTLLPALFVAAAGSVASADSAYVSADTDTVQVEHPGMYSYAWRDDSLKSRIGIGMTLGGGVTGFTDSGMRSTIDSNAGGLWDFRVALGTHIPIGLELGYVGTATSLNGLSGQNATLVSTTAEAALRYNMLPHYMVTPYAFAGVGWQRYDVTGANFTRADTGFRDSDNLVVYPLGVGVGYRSPSGFIADARGTLRLAGNSNLVVSSTGNDLPLHTWEASGAVGYEF